MSKKICLKEHINLFFKIQGTTGMEEFHRLKHILKISPSENRQEKRL